ncbi:MAG: T9SS type A sorting domain-containing protein, partial [Bacteroidota bacterium]
TMRVETGGQNNRYQWFLDDVPINGATQATYTITSMRASDAGVYYCTINNTLATELTLRRLPINVSVECSLVDDQITTNATGVFCEGGATQVSLFAPAGDFTYQWFRDGQAIFLANDSTYITNSSGDYVVRLRDANGCQTFSDTFNLASVPSPEVVILPGSEPTVLTFISDSELAGFQWYLNDEPIEGANEGTLTTTETGEYYLIVTDSNGCTGQSNILFFNVTGLEDEEVSLQTRLYPNPLAGDEFYLELPSEVGEIELIELIDNLGRNLRNLTFKQPQSSVSRYRVSGLDGVPVGVYYVRVQTTKAVILKELFLE